jgi:hypothetical protein
MTRLTCPKDPTHKEFETTAHVMQAWAVEQDGDWIRTLNESMQTSVPPDFHGNMVTCLHCGADAKVED